MDPLIAAIMQDVVRLMRLPLLITRFQLTCSGLPHLQHDRFQ
jgi:hypothetical protein